MLTKELFKVDLGGEGEGGREAYGSDVKMHIPDIEKLIFCSFSFSFKFCNYCQESF